MGLLLQLWAQTGYPVPPELLTPLASAGGLGILIWFMHVQLNKAEERTKMAEERAGRAEADARAVRDSFIRDVAPIMATTIDHQKRLVESAERLVEVAQRLAMGRPPTL